MYVGRNRASLQRHVFYSLGARPIEELKAPEILAILRNMVDRGTFNAAERVRTVLKDETSLKFAPRQPVRGV